MTPTALTMRFLRRAGYLVDVCERWVPRANVRRDLFTVIDVVAITVGKPILGVQATSLANVSARVKKARECPALAVWLRTGARFQVFGWTKRHGRWFPKIVELRAGDLAPEVLARPPHRRGKLHQPVDLFTALG
jgi:hypothetical protein